MVKSAKISATENSDHGERGWTIANKASLSLFLLLQHLVCVSHLQHSVSHTHTAQTLGISLYTAVFGVKKSVDRDDDNRNPSVHLQMFSGPALQQAVGLY